MIIELAIGIIIGIIIGVTPGLYPNTVIPLIILPNNSLRIILVSMLISSNYFEFIKATYLSAPSDNNALSIKYAQKLVMNGRGAEAIKLMSIGALGTTIITAISAPILISIIPPINNIIKDYVIIILTSITTHMVLKEGVNIGKATKILILSGALGLITLRTQIINQPLLPLLTGLFGLSNIITNLESAYPSQMRQVITEVSNKTKIKGIIKAFISSSIITFTPAIGPSQSAMISNELVKTRNQKEKLITLGGVNTGDVLFSLTAYYTINKARSGVIERIGRLDLSNYLTLIVITVITSIICYLIINKVNTKISSKLEKVNYQKLNKTIMLFIIIINLLICGWVGLIVLLTATLIGLMCLDYEVNQNILMSSIIIPVMFYYA